MAVYLIEANEERDKYQVNFISPDKTKRYSKRMYLSDDEALSGDVVGESPQDRVVSIYSVVGDTKKRVYPDEDTVSPDQLSFEETPEVISPEEEDLLCKEYNSVLNFYVAILSMYKDIPESVKLRFNMNSFIKLIEDKLTDIIGKLKSINDRIAMKVLFGKGPGPDSRYREYLSKYDKSR